MSREEEFDSDTLLGSGSYLTIRGFTACCVMSVFSSFFDFRVTPGMLTSSGCDETRDGRNDDVV